MKYFKVFTDIAGKRKARVACYKPISAGSDIIELTMDDGEIFIYEAEKARDNK